MLKSLLVSGWFRIKPFFKYIVILIIVSPLVGTSVNGNVVKQSDKGNTKLGYGKSKSKLLENSTSETVAVQFNQYVLLDQVNLEPKTPVNKYRDEGLKSSVGNGAKQQSSQVVAEAKNPETRSSEINNKSTVENNPVEESKKPQLKKVETQKSEKSDSELLVTVKVVPDVRGLESPDNKPINADGPAQSEEMVQNDPIGSPHPIPWQWIVATQENVGAGGKSGVRYYRSLPVVSTDGRYAIYSRVEMTIKPEMHNSKVNSVLFIEDRQTKKLRVMLSTNQKINDPLLNGKEDKLAEELAQNGKIEVLVPVSWSKSSDRFLARKFVALFNTADATDEAVIWNRQDNNINTISPHQESQEDHEKIAILLGWSKNQPNNVLFRSGELGDEEWPLIQVSNDGKTVETSVEGDQAVIFGDTGKIWADPQVASR